jgi:WS/DGAT/MGAT family acyltransferase
VTAGPARAKLPVVPARLTALDASFLHLETPTAHMHVAWRGRFRPTPGRPRPTLDALRESVAARLRWAPRFRQRLLMPPAGLGEPAWIDDDDFDVAHHVRLLGDPWRPVTERRFVRMADDELSRPLDRRRPLWQVHLVPELEGGDVGLVVKMHHALVDGQSAVAVALLLFDVEPDAPGAAVDDWRPADVPGLRSRAVHVAAEAGTLPVRIARGVLDLAPRLLEAEAWRALAQDVLRPAPPSPLNVPIGRRRTLVGHRVPLDALVAVKRAHGVTHNDVCLAIVAGALRDVALDTGHAPAALKVMVPVSVRADSEREALGNRISFAFIDLPLHLSSGLRRLKAIHAATTAFKRSRRPAATEALMGVAEALPPLLHGTVARSLSGPRVYNLVVSNVPGPPQPVYMLGAELLDAYPAVPLSDGHGLSVGLFTYRDGVHVGCYADPDAFPAVDRLPAALERATDELVPRESAPRPRVAALQTV